MVNNYTKNYIDKFSLLLKDKKNLSKKIELTTKALKKTYKKNKIIIFGNGGSSSIASHFTIDIIKNTKLECINFNDPAIITCFSNDYGYENWIKEALRFYAEKDDLLIIFSCSGKSKNLLNAARYAKKNQINLVTFTGININNPLKKLNSSGLNIFVNSKSYNQIEIIHHLFILLTIDLCIGKKNYPVS